MINLYLLDKWWWRYAFEEPFNWVKFWCRIRNHPCGVIYYSSGGAPDMHCKDCGDDLG